MNNFDARHDKRIAKLQRLALIVGVTQFILVLCVLSFVGWVVIKILQNQGIV